MDEADEFFQMKLARSTSCDPEGKQGNNMTETIYDIPLKTIDGKTVKLNQYRGKVLLIVNVASKCGLTPQYESLQKLYKSKKSEGLEILGFPANNFGDQEPGGNAEIQKFCSLTYNVSFPMFEKISVNGEDRHPLYKTLINAQPKAQDTEAMREMLASHGIKPANDTDILWNFEKFVINRIGDVVARLSPDVTAADERLLSIIEKGLYA